MDTVKALIIDMIFYEVETITFTWEKQQNTLFTAEVQCNNTKNNLFLPKCDKNICFGAKTAFRLLLLKIKLT